MRTLLLTPIFLIAILIGKLKAQSAIQSMEHPQCIISSGGCSINVVSVTNKEEAIQKMAGIFKSSMKETDDSLVTNTSKRPGGSFFKFKDNRHKLGLITGYGDQKGLHVSYNYEIVFFQFQYYYSLLKKKSWGIEVLLQPQYNATKYKNGFSEEGKLRGHEFGLNMGFLVRKKIVNDFLSSYLLISAGPHYVSGAPERQADGFIFSDNFFAGISIKVFKSVYLDIRGGFRHISNAGFKDPNKGVNSLIINEGFYLAL